MIMQTIQLISYSKDYLSNIMGALGKCYGKKCGVLTLKKSMEAGHLSILEHAYATFDIRCSLAVLGQITRHRHFSFTVKSSRGAKFSLDDLYLPDSIDNIADTHYKEQIYSVITDYLELINCGVPVEDAAYLLPKGMLTELRITGNLRAWYEYLPKRLCERALPEHRKIAIIIQEELESVMPEIFAGVTANCESCKEAKCKF